MNLLTRLTKTSFAKDSCSTHDQHIYRRVCRTPMSVERSMDSGERQGLQIYESSVLYEIFLRVRSPVNSTDIGRRCYSERNMLWDNFDFFSVSYSWCVNALIYQTMSWSLWDLSFCSLGYCTISTNCSRGCDRDKETSVVHEFTVVCDLWQENFSSRSAAAQLTVNRPMLYS